MLSLRSSNSWRTLYRKSPMGRCAAFLALVGARPVRGWKRGCPVAGSHCKDSRSCCMFFSRRRSASCSRSKTSVSSCMLSVVKSPVAATSGWKVWSSDIQHSYSSLRSRRRAASMKSSSCVDLLYSRMITLRSFISTLDLRLMLGLKEHCLSSSSSICCLICAIFFSFAVWCVVSCSRRHESAPSIMRADTLEISGPGFKLSTSLCAASALAAACNSSSCLRWILPSS
mmetsp:Transcript_20007/g.38147  ORF Transcript_20007/g.38147 Transcript_20007/m.38147 type:complete len:228 (-) Transcript_20007:85-768(-)